WRIPYRPRSREHDEGGEEEPQGGQPPGRARGRFFLRLDVEQNPRGRKADAPRPRRHEAQQPPQNREGGERKQQERRGESERQADHAAAPASGSARPTGRRRTLTSRVSPLRAR